MRLSTHGETVARFADGRDEVPIIVRLGAPHQGSSDPIERIRALTILAAGGAVVRLSQVVSIEQQTSPAWIYRHNGRRRVIVRIAAESDKARKSVEKALRTTLAQIEKSAPGIKVVVGK